MLCKNHAKFETWNIWQIYCDYVHDSHILTVFAQHWIKLTKLLILQSMHYFDWRQRSGQFVPKSLSNLSPATQTAWCREKRKEGVRPWSLLQFMPTESHIVDSSGLGDGCAIANVAFPSGACSNALCQATSQAIHGLPTLHFNIPSCS